MQGILILFLVSLVWGSHATSYENYKIYNIQPKTREHCDLMNELSKNEEWYDFFNLKKIPEPTQLMVHRDGEKDFIEVLKENGIQFDVTVQNLGEVLAKEEQDHKKTMKLEAGLGRALSTSVYHEYDEIMNYVDELGKRFPTRAFVRNVGKSYEGRILKTITITNGDGRTGKNLIFVDGGMHAREWISPAEVLYILEQLVEKFDENADLLKDYDWMILPIINVDGYSYSRKTEKMWRKTRKPYLSGKSICFGADPNRNFGVHWMENGASAKPCEDTYGGPKPFSEPETSILRDVLHSVKNRGKFYLTLHSYGKYLLYPWGWTSELPSTWKDIHEVAQTGADAILAATNTKYKVGSSTNVLYAAAGGSDDYAYDSGFPISITMELPGAGWTGFHPPTSRIDEMVKETWIGIRAMALKVIEKYPTKY